MIEQILREHPEQISVRRLCSLFGVSRSRYYQKKRTEAQPDRDLELRDAIERIILEFPGYGYRRVTKELARRGWHVNHKKVLRIMREQSLLCQLKKRFFVPTTDSRHPFGRYANLIKDALIEEPDRAWLADITYVRLPTTFCYLATIIDDFSRYCVGWALSKWIDTSLTLEALETAIGLRRPKPGLIHHSDQGVQYASGEYIARLEQIGAKISMASVGNPYENAKAESFFRTLKMEEVYIKDYRTFKEAHQNIGEFIEEVYNRKRLHSSLGYVPPAEFEAQYVLRTGGRL